MKTKLLALLIFNFSFLIYTCDSSAEIRFVSKTGSSAPPYTTWATASDSIQKCINICNDGDTVVVANGVYWEFLTIDSAITLLGMSMDSTVIDGTGLGDYNTIRANNNLTIKEFKIIGKGFNASPQYTAITNIFYSINIEKCNISNSNIGIYLGRSSGVVDSVFMHNVNRGVYTFCAYDTCKPVIKNSVIIIRETNSDDSDGMINFHGGQPKILNNIIIGNGKYSGVEVINPVRSISMKNNLIGGFWRGYENGAGVIDTTYIVNNVFRDQISNNNSTDASISFPNSRAYIRNNIISNSDKGIQTEATLNSDYNLFWNNEINANNGSAFGEHDLFVDPMFVKDTIARSLAYDYHLQAYSPAIDAGDKLIQDVDGSRSDIGLFGGPGGTSYIYLNLPPKPPVNFHSSFDSSKITISWDKFSEADFSHYNIYRSVVNNFIPDSSSYYCRRDTSYFIDEIPIVKDKIYYKITSVDSAGNESVPGEQIVVTVTGIGEPFIEIVGEYKLYQNYPNPFNPVTIIPFRLKERGYVKVMVYDIKGELITTIVNETKEAGFYEAEFYANGLASGIYLYRIEVVGEGNIPVYMNMRKMLMIK